MSIMAFKSTGRHIINSMLSPFRFIKMASCSALALRRAIAINATGLAFDSFGRRSGWQLTLRGYFCGIEYLFHPITHVRYLEYSFVSDCLPSKMSKCLDVSSPRLFSLYVSRHRDVNISMINPDAADLKYTALMLQRLPFPGISLYHDGVEMLDDPAFSEIFDVIWSISVIEHIEGKISDSDAVKLMYNALKNKGRLILTFPVDRELHVQSSTTQQYGTQPLQADDTYFFQRFYDAEAIKSRLSLAIGKEPTIIRWFGEIKSGWYNQYVNHTSRSGEKWAVADVWEISKNFREYDSWDHMPGVGICGVMYEKS